MTTNGRLVVLVSAGAVAAVALGGGLAYRQGPSSVGTEAAAPLSASVSTPTSAGSSKTTTLDVRQLPEGPAPRIPYLIGRQVRGGGEPVTIPGDGAVVAFARVKSSVLAYVSHSNTSELLTIAADGRFRSTEGVNSLVATHDHTAAAYTIPRTDSVANTIGGGTVYAVDGTSVKQLEVTGDWALEVVAYTQGKIFYRTGEAVSGPPWKLYEWTPGAVEARLVKTVPDVSAFTADAKIGAALPASNKGPRCTNVTVLETGRRLWETCYDYLADFTPDGAVVIGSPVISDVPCSKAYVALDAKTGALIHEWKVCVVHAVAEDDQHLLLSVLSYTDYATIRCTIRTGACERATPFSAEYNQLGR